MEEIIINERKFKEDLVSLINESKLPAMVIKPVLKELLEQITILEQSQYNEAQKSIEKKVNK